MTNGYIQNQSCLSMRPLCMATKFKCSYFSLYSFISVTLMDNIDLYHFLSYLFWQIIFFPLSLSVSLSLSLSLPPSPLPPSPLSLSLSLPSPPPPPSLALSFFLCLLGNENEYTRMKQARHFGERARVTETVRASELVDDDDEKKKKKKGGGVWSELNAKPRAARIALSGSQGVNPGHSRLPFMRYTLQGAISPQSRQGGGGGGGGGYSRTEACAFEARQFVSAAPSRFRWWPEEIAVNRVIYVDRFRVDQLAGLRVIVLSLAPLSSAAALHDSC